MIIRFGRNRSLWIAAIVAICLISLVSFQTMVDRSDSHLMLLARAALEKELVAMDRSYDASPDDCHFISPGGEVGVYRIIGCIARFNNSKFYFAIAFDAFGQTVYMQGDILK